MPAERASKCLLRVGDLVRPRGPARPNLSHVHHLSPLFRRGPTFEDDPGGLVSSKNSVFDPGACAVISFNRASRAVARSLSRQPGPEPPRQVGIRRGWLRGRWSRCRGRRPPAGASVRWCSTKPGSWAISEFLVDPSGLFSCHFDRFRSWVTEPRVAPGVRRYRGRRFHRRQCRRRKLSILRAAPGRCSSAASRAMAPRFDRCFWGYPPRSRSNIRLTSGPELDQWHITLPGDTGHRPLVMVTR